MCSQKRVLSLSIEKMREVAYHDLREFQRTLLTEAERVMETAYNPYSRFYVGAALLSNKGIIAASNVENSAYGSTICAERAAIVKANSMGIRTFDAVAIIARGESFDTKEVTGPCGACRQMLFESSQLSEVPLEVIMSNSRKDKIVVATIEELLPLAFGPRELGIDVSRFR